MKRRFSLAVLAAAVLAASAAFAATSTPKGFTDDLDAALAEAAKSNRRVLACFSGSDWCGWCKRLDSEVFGKRPFIAGATNDFVLAFIDSPSDQKLLSPKARKRNPSLVKKYGVSGFPTVLLLNADGTVAAKTGYRPGGPEKYVSHLKNLLENAPEIARIRGEIDRLMERLKELEGGR